MDSYSTKNRHNSSTLLQGAHRFFGSCCNAGVFKTQGFAALTSARTAACSMKLWRMGSSCENDWFHLHGIWLPPPKKNARGLGANHSRAMVRFSSCPDAQRLKSQAPPGESADEKPTTLQHWCSWCRQVQHFEPKKPSLVGHKWDQQQVKDFTGCCDNKPTGKKKEVQNVYSNITASESCVEPGFPSSPVALEA